MFTLSLSFVALVLTVAVVFWINGESAYPQDNEQLLNHFETEEMHDE